MANANLTVRVGVEGAGAAGAEIQRFAGGAAATFGRLSAGLTATTTGMSAFGVQARVAHFALMGMEQTAHTFGVNILPPMATNIGYGTMALYDMAKAAKFAHVSLLSVSGMVAVLTGIGAIGKYGIEAGKALAGEQTSAGGVESTISSLTDSIRKIAAARREAGKMSEAEYQTTLKQIAAANLEVDSADRYNALKKISNDLRNEGWTLNHKDFLELRKVDETDIQWKRKNTDQLLVGKTEEVQAAMRLGDITEEIAQIEERRKFTGQALDEGVINEAEQRELELRDLNEIVRLEQERQQIKERQITGDWRLTDAEKYARLKEMGAPPNTPNPASWSDQWTAGVLKVQNAFGTLQQKVTGGFFNIVQSGFDSLGQGITKVIMGTESWGRMFAQIGAQILSMLINLVVQVALMELILVPLGLSNGGMVPGLPGGGIVPGLAGGGLADFAPGGFTGPGGKYDVAGIVHRGEFVMPAQAVNRIGVPALEALRHGEGGGGGSNVQLAFFGGEADAKKWANSTDGEVWFVNMMDRHAHRYQRRG